MKKFLPFIALICLGSSALAQSSVSDVQSAKPATPVKPEPAVSSINATTQKPVAAKSSLEPQVNSTNTGLQIAPSTKPENPKKGTSSLGEVTPTLAVPAEPVNTKIVTSPAANSESIIISKGGVPTQASASIATPVTAELTPATKLPETKIDNSRKVQMAEVPPSIVNPVVQKPVPNNMQGTEKKKEKE